ncbi:MAG: hypothetical protein ACSHXY_05220 [Alphaproteobacteria bacterium]
MNLAKLLTGCFKALGRSQDWERYFNFSKSGFQQSFLALFLSIPFYYVCAAAVQQHQALIAGAEHPNALPTASFIIILVFYTLTFVVSAYIFSLVFDKMASFRPWVIVRHWSIFFATFFAALLMGANMAGVLPFFVAVYAVMGIYLLTLAIDIRLAARIAGFKWGEAVLTGCLITAMGLAILLIGVAQYV